MGWRGTPALAALIGWSSACATTGSKWLNEPPKASADARQSSIERGQSSIEPRAGLDATPSPLVSEAQTEHVARASSSSSADDGPLARAEHEGRVLGLFRNTYYNFPEERDYGGARVGLFDARCEPLGRVPLEFHDTLCVQGSGLLASGRTVSFARRGCPCARVCPRTGQKICFEALPAAKYPWGRGAAGLPIQPLVTVAVDSSVIPLGTRLFIPDYVGLPRGGADGMPHDGCFIAQDRGIKVRGEHVDIFTGQQALTRLWNGLVPSNRGVTVILDSPRCSAPE